MQKENIDSTALAFEKPSSFERAIFRSFIIFLAVLFCGLLIVGRSNLRCPQLSSPEETLHAIDDQLMALSTMIDNGDFVGTLSSQGVTVELLLDCKMDILRAIHHQNDGGG